MASRSFAIIISQHASKALSAPDVANLPTDFIARIDDPVFQSLMIAFYVEVVDELFQGPLQRPAAEEDHSVEALGFQGSHVPFEDRIQIGTFWRQQDDFGVGQVIHVGAERLELCVPVNEQMACSQQESVCALSQVPRDLLYPLTARILCDPSDFDSPGFQAHDDEDVEGGQAVPGPNLDGGEVDGRDGLPMRLEERLPGCR